MNRFILYIAIVVALVPAAAVADQDQAQPSSMASTGSFDSVRSKAGPSILMTDGSLTLGADLAFMTADGGLGDSDVRFTDVVLFRPRLRYALGKKVEAFAGTTLLPKQPSYTDELVWQGARMGALIGLSSRYAVFVQASGGPMMNSAGYWTGVDLGVQARKVLEKVIVFQGSLGGSGSRLWYSQDTAEAFWFAEVASHGEIMLQAPRGEVGAWLGVDYRVPVVHNPGGPDPVSGVSLDPQTRVNFHLGIVLALSKEWDIFAEYIIIDRGDVEAPATTLPVLEGGFDQRHLVLGLLRRFDTRTAPRALIAY